METLAALSELRPKTSHDAGAQSLIPSPAALRRLHRTIPTEPTPGWYGTLPESQPTAVHDDSTLKIKPRPVATRATHTPPVATPVAATPPAYYTNYPQQPFRPGGYAPYGTAPPYYNPYAGQAGQQYYSGQAYAQQPQQQQQVAGWYGYSNPSAPGYHAPTGMALVKPATAAQITMGYTGQTQGVPPLPAHLRGTNSPVVANGAMSGY